MRAVVVHEFGPIDSHSLENVPDPTPGPEEVLVDVHAIGVNFPDTLMVQGLYQTKPDRPFTPGRDSAGIVAAVGDKVSRIKPGDRIVSLVTFGAYAEKVIAPQSRCFHLPEGIDFVTGAGMFTVYNTAYVALMARGQFKPGETVLVVGASGGVGLACVEVAKAKGAIVIAGDISEQKCAMARAHGADFTIDLARDDLRESLRRQVFAVTDGRGVDVVLDPVGGDVFDAAIRALAFAGRIVAIGFASGCIPEAKAGYFNVKNLTMAGMALDLHFRFAPELIRDAVADVFDMCIEGRIRPEITATYGLEEFHTALGRLAARESIGKMVLTTGRDG